MCWRPRILYVFSPALLLVEERSIPFFLTRPLRKGSSCLSLCPPSPLLSFTSVFHPSRSPSFCLKKEFPSASEFPLGLGGSDEGPQPPFSFNNFSCGDGWFFVLPFLSPRFPLPFFFLSSWQIAFCPIYLLLSRQVKFFLCSPPS